MDKTILVYFTAENLNDWIPSGMNEKRTFNLHDKKTGRGNPSLLHLEYTIRRVLGETELDLMDNFTQEDRQGGLKWLMCLL